MEEWVQIGILGKPHALAGAFFVAGREADSPLDKTVRSIKIKTKAGQEFVFKKTSEKNISGRMILTVDGVSSREKVEELSGSVVSILRSEMLLRDNDFLWSDLLGVQVVDVHENALGTIEEIENFGAGEIVVLKQGDKKVRLPFIPAYFDFDFKVDKGPLRLPLLLRLIVPAEDIAEFWHA